MQPKRSGKLMIAMRLLRLALGNPLMILRFMHPCWVKKALMFLARNEWNLQHLLMRAEQFHFQRHQESKKLLSERIFPLIARYGLPHSGTEQG